MHPASMQHPSPDATKWSRQRSTDTMNGYTSNMSTLHQESAQLTQSIKISFDPVAWSNPPPRQPPCTKCIFKSQSPVDGDLDCLECSPNFSASLRAASSIPSSPNFTAKLEPPELDLFSSEEMAKSMSHDSGYASINNNLINGLGVNMADVFQAGSAAYSQYVQTEYSQPPSQYDSSESHFEYSSVYDNEPLDVYRHLSPLDQSVYPISSPIMPYDAVSHLEGQTTMLDTQQHMDLPPSPTQTIDVLTPNAKEKFRCSYEDCGRSFGRQADLQRHQDHVHPDPHATQNGHACDYPKCTRQVSPFRRKDHFRDHLREFHKEDLLRRGGNETNEWFKDRNINPAMWRCGRCLRRNSLDKRGYTCHKCKVECEPARVSHREARQRATSQSSRNAYVHLPQVMGQPRVTKSQPQKRNARHGLGPALTRIDTRSPSSMSTERWQGPATAPVTESRMFSFSPHTSCIDLTAPFDGIFTFGDEQLPLSV